MPRDAEEFFVRRIVTGLIVSTDYLRGVSKIWDNRLMNSAVAEMLADWCFEHFEKYDKAPGKDIRNIYVDKLRNGLPKDRANDIEEILASLSDEHEREQFNADYLLDQTKNYLREQKLRRYAEDIRDALDRGTLIDAERLVSEYSPLAQEAHNVVDPFSCAETIERAFAEKVDPLIKFPKALGRFWNEQFVRDSFIALMGPDKRGKSYLLLEIAIRAMSNGCNVVFFQAGDMSERQQIRRLCIYISKRSDLEKYCQGQFIPVVDCMYNQNDECTRPERECGFGPFKGLSPSEIENTTHAKLKEKYEEHPDYVPCRNCEHDMAPPEHIKQQKHYFHGTVWLKWQDKVEPLDWETAYDNIVRFQKWYGTRFKLCTYPSGTLTLAEIKSLLDLWERQEQFVPDVIVIDYADLMAPDPDFNHLDVRNRTNELWSRLRGLSQKKHCIVVTATQSATTSYTRNLIVPMDFSEDKRKNAHVTAMYGLNQSPEEKLKGILRINQVVLREGEFQVTNQVNILQRLQMGRPYLGGFEKKTVWEPK